MYYFIINEPQTQQLFRNNNTECYREDGNKEEEEIK